MAAWVLLPLPWLYNYLVSKVLPSHNVFARKFFTLRFLSSLILKTMFVGGMGGGMGGGPDMGSPPGDDEKDSDDEDVPELVN